MKLIRVLLIAAGLILGVGTLLVGLAALPSVQRWALLRATGRLPNLQLEVASVSVGWSRASATGVKLVHQGMPIAIGRLEVEISPYAFLTGNQVRIGRLVVNELMLDASGQSRAKVEAAATGAPAVVPGLLASLELPFELSLAEAMIDGQAKLPPSRGEALVEASFKLTGGGFSAGKEGRLVLDARLRNPAEGAQVHALDIHAELQATLAGGRRFTQAKLTTMAEAKGPALAGPSQLKIGAGVYASSGGENYEVSVSTLQNGAAENLLILRGQLPTGSRVYQGEWALKARNSQLEPFVLGSPLPEFDVAGDGRFSFDAPAESIQLDGGVQAILSRLEAIDPAWRVFGGVRVEADFDLGHQAGVVELRRFKGTVAAAEPVLEIQTAQPVRYDLRQRSLRSQGGADALLSVNLLGLPLAWIHPFVPGANFSGGGIVGKIEVVHAPGVVADATLRGQFQIDDFNLTHQGRAFLTKAIVRSKWEAQLAGGGVTVPALDISLRTPDGDRVDLVGRAKVEAGPDAPIAFAGRMDALATKLLEPWLPGSPVAARAEVEFSLRGGALEMLPGKLTVTQGSGRSLLELQIAQPFGLNLKSLGMQPKDPAVPIGRLNLGQIPLSALQLAGPGAVLGGQIVQGAFELVAPGGIITLRPLEALRLADISLAQNRRPAIERVSLEAKPVISYGGTGALAVRTGDVLIRSNRGPLGTLSGEFIQAPGQDTQAVANFTVEVPALIAQPLFVGTQAVSAGRASGEVRAVVGNHSQLEARVTLNGLILAESGRGLPVANLGFRARMQSSGAVSIQMPILLDNAGRRTDLNFALELTPLGRGYSLDGSLTGQQVELEDLLGVLAVFSAAAAPESGGKPAPSATVAPDTVSAWSRFSGRLLLDIKSVARGQEWAMTGLSGTMAIEPALVSLPKLAATFSADSRLAASAELRFTGGPMPYRLTGDYSLTEFDAGRLFRALESSRAPTVEGLFNVAGNFSGNGETPQRAIDRVQGELQLTSRQGVFRGLQRSAGKLSVTSKAVELGASVLGSILGSDKAVRTAEKVAGQAYFVDQLAQSLGEFNYDLFSLKLSRDELLNMNLENINLVSPEIRLSGRGSVSFVVGEDLLDQPLSAALNIAARGKVEQLLGRLRLLDATKDELGYSRARDPITIGGTLAKPDPTAFFSRIAASRIADFLDFEN